MLDIFSPYLPFMATLVAVIVNVLLIVLKSPWYSYLIANAMLSAFWLFVDPTLTPWSIITSVIESIIDIFEEIFAGIFTKGLTI